MTIGVVCWVGWPAISPIKISSLDLLPNHFFRFNSSSLPLYQVSYGCSHVCKKKLSRDTTKLPYIIYVTLKYFYLYMKNFVDTTFNLYHNFCYNPNVVTMKGKEKVVGWCKSDIQLLTINYVKDKLQLIHLWFGRNLSCLPIGLKFDTLPTWGLIEI